MDTQQRAWIKALLQQEVVVATGCTEPGAVALCVSKARELLGRMPDRVEVWLSKNVYKNALGVGIPGTGMIGLPIAIAMAVVAGDTQRGLQVLNMPREEVEKAKLWLNDHSQQIQINAKKDCDKLYIECVCACGNHKATAIIARRHDSFVFLKKDDEILLDCREMPLCGESQDCVESELTTRVVYDYATTAPIEELRFIDETVRLNKCASDAGLEGYGLNAGRIMMQHANGDVVHTVVARTVAASDARMDGCMLPVYSNSGSGNQGITCTLPVYEFGVESHCDPERITRALVMSHLMSIYIKRGIGRLSALCGIVNASIGVGAAITYLQGGTYEEITFAIRNMINTISGMVCDGAKPSCALKMSAGLYSAFVASNLAVKDKVVDPTDGLAEPDVDCSIRNLCQLGRAGMESTDDVILDIMMHKKFQS